MPCIYMRRKRGYQLAKNNSRLLRTFAEGSKKFIFIHIIYIYLVVITENFSKFNQLYPVTKANTHMAIKSLDKFINRYGIPKRIVCDNGSQFTSTVWQDSMKNRNIKIVYTSIRHPRSNKTERVNRDLGEYFRVLLANKKHTKWPLQSVNSLKRYNSN